MNESSPLPDSEISLERLMQLEQRVARLEAQLGFKGEASPVTTAVAPTVPSPRDAGTTPMDVLAATATADERREFEVGQSWFAQAGILALTIGLGFLVSLPHPGLPAFAPAAVGFLMGAALLGVGYFARKSLEMVGNPLRAAAMALLFISSLRLFFPSTRHLLEIDSASGKAILAGVTGFNLWLAWQRRSEWLLGLAIAMGCATALFVGTAAYLLAAVAGLALLGVAVSERISAPRVAIAAMPLTYLTYFLWAMGNPLRGGTYHFLATPALAPALLLLIAAAFGIGMLRRGGEASEDAYSHVSTFLNCALGYGIFLVHTAAAHPQRFVAAQVGASLVLLGLAAAFWRRRHSHVATFLYAMTGYAALSLAIMKASAMPQVFVWLSLQSVLVVATAIWFRSRFIVVANFAIFVAIILGYMVVARRETGISLGFGIVSLVSARILNWQRERLELKTELMRNAYLVSAFIVFPYALYHLVSGKYVAVAWVALASAYYVLNLFVNSPKYRWMGHGTLGLATVYAVLAGVSRFDPVYRMLTFLVLGTVLLIVAVSFNRALRGRRAGKTPAGPT